MKYLLVAMIFVATIPQIGHAQTIKLKGGLFNSLRFSIDGQNYQTIGDDGEKLIEAMRGYEKSIEQVHKYRTDRKTAVITGLGAVLSLIVAVISADGHWNRGNTVVASCGIGIGVTSVIYEKKANDHLKLGVELYNESITPNHTAIESHSLHTNRIQLASFRPEIRFQLTLQL